MPPLQYDPSACDERKDLLGEGDDDTARNGQHTVGTGGGVMGLERDTELQYAESEKYDTYGSDEPEDEIGEVVDHLNGVVTLRERGDSRAEHEYRRAQDRKDPFGPFVKMHYQYLPPYCLIVRLRLQRRYPR